VAEQRVWTGQHVTEGQPATTAATVGDGSDQVTIVPAGAGRAEFSKLNPLVAGYGSIRFITAAVTGERCRGYESFSATDGVSHVAAFRLGKDPLLATGLVNWVVGAAGSQGAGGLILKRVQGVGQLQLVDHLGAEIAGANFGAVPIGRDVDDWVITRMTTKRNTAAAAPFNGAHTTEVFDYTGTLLGDYTATGVETFPDQYVRVTWGLNSARDGDMEITALHTLTDLPVQQLPLPTAPPSEPPNMPPPTIYPNVHLVRHPATPTRGGTITYSSDPAATVVPAPGWSAFTKQAVAYEVRVSSTESSTSLTSNRYEMIPALASGSEGTGVPMRSVGPNPGNGWA
jgi:hypothetical protein